MGYMKLSSSRSGNPGLVLLIHLCKVKESGLSLSECRMLEEMVHLSDERVLEFLRWQSLGCSTGEADRVVLRQRKAVLKYAG